MDGWQPVHTKDWLPSSLQSCGCYLQSSLLTYPENHWGSWEERLQAAAASQRISASHGAESLAGSPFALKGLSSAGNSFASSA